MLSTAGAKQPCRTALLRSGELLAELFALAASFATDCAKLKSLNQSSDTLHNAGVGVLIAGGAVGVATLIYAVVPMRGDAPKAGMRVVPLVGGTNGLLVQGTF